MFATSHGAVSLSNRIVCIISVVSTIKVSFLCSQVRGPRDGERRRRVPRGRTAAFPSSPTPSSIPKPHLRRQPNDDAALGGRGDDRQDRGRRGRGSPRHGLPRLRVNRQTTRAPIPTPFNECPLVSIKVVRTVSP